MNMHRLWSMPWEDVRVLSSSRTSYGPLQLGAWATRQILVLEVARVSNTTVRESNFSTAQLLHVRSYFDTDRCRT